MSAKSTRGSRKRILSDAVVSLTEARRPKPAEARWDIDTDTDSVGGGPRNAWDPACAAASLGAAECEMGISQLPVVRSPLKEFTERMGSDCGE